MSKALLVIDYTYDFVADDGRLTCGKPAQAIDEYITQLTKSFVADGDYVVFAVDVHDENDAFHPETKLFHRTTFAQQRAETCTVRSAATLRNWQRRDCRTT